MNNGWIKLWRKIQNSDMYAELTAEQRDVMIQCLLTANHKEKEWEWDGGIQKCKPGQFKTSLNSLKKKCASNVSIQNIRTAISKLEKWGFLTNQPTKSGRIITICNWGSYQGKDNQTNKETNKELTKSQQRANKELTTNKNVKNANNKKKKKPHLQNPEIYEAWEKYGLVKHPKSSWYGINKTIANRKIKGYSTEDLIDGMKGLYKAYNSGEIQWSAKWGLTDLFSYGYEREPDEHAWLNDFIILEREGLQETSLSINQQPPTPNYVKDLTINKNKTK